MRKAILAAILGVQAAMASVATADTAATAATVDPIFNFIQSSLLGHPVKAQATGIALTGTDITADWKASNFVNGLVRTSNGIAFDRTFVVNQTNHVPQADGTSRDVVVDRVGTHHCMLKVSGADNAPAGIMLGLCVSVQNTVADINGSGYLINARMEGANLVLRTTSQVPADCFANTSTGTRLCTSKSVETFAVVDGKATLSYVSEDSWLMDVDANTLAPKGTQTLDYKED
jgi:hypothetical protein